MSISWYECAIITQIHYFGSRGLSLATILAYGQGKIAESRGISQGKGKNNEL